jgi:hypothetical protein
VLWILQARRNPSSNANGWQTGHRLSRGQAIWRVRRARSTWVYAWLLLEERKSSGQQTLANKNISGWDSRPACGSTLTEARRRVDVRMRAQDSPCAAARHDNSPPPTETGAWAANFPTKPSEIVFNFSTWRSSDWSFVSLGYMLAVRPSSSFPLHQSGLSFIYDRN